MSVITNIKNTTIGLLLFMTASSLHGQGLNNHIKIQMGGGYGVYFNTFTNVPHYDIMIHKPNFTAKLFWEAEHRLRIGIESGYYFIYSTDAIRANDMSEDLITHLQVIPMFFNVSMNLYKNIEASFSTGWVSMLYYVSTSKSKRGSITGKTMSKYNIMLGLNYHYPISKRFDLGLELKYLNISKTLDNQASITFNLSYKIFSWK